MLKKTLIFGGESYKHVTRLKDVDETPKNNERHWTWGLLGCSQ